MNTNYGVIDEIERDLIDGGPEGKTINEMADRISRLTGREFSKVRNTVRTQTSRLRKTRGLTVTRSVGPDGVSRFSATK